MSRYHFWGKAPWACAWIFALGMTPPGLAFQVIESPNIIQKSLDDKNYEHAKNLIFNLEPADRLQWIDALREVEGHGPFNLSESDREFIDATTSDLGADGGGALPNFSELIRLIERTVDGDWQTDGGPSVILPHQNGVRVDREGILQRVSPAELEGLEKARETRGTVDWGKLGTWQTPSELRWVSLKELDQLAKKAQESKRTASLAEALLGGLCRIDYVAWDEASKSWFLGGPAGDLVLNENGDLVHRTLRLPPVLLEDAAVVGATLFSGQRSFGCSIDPDEERLKNAHSFSSTPNTLFQLRAQPKAWVEKWKNTLGPQSTRVFGIPAQTTTALALLIADAEMKRMALEFDELPKSIRSFWQEADLLNRQPQGGIIRWWYTLGTKQIPFDKERMIYRIPAANINLMSETQYFNLQGGRAVAALPEIAADAFARNFTQHHEDIQRISVAQGRLRHIFDLAVAFELIRGAEEKARKAEFSQLFQDSIPITLATVPSTIDSIATSHLMPNGTVVAVASGGINIDTRRIESRLSRSKRELEEIAQPQLPAKRIHAEGASAEQETAPDVFWYDAPVAVNAPAVKVPAVKVPAVKVPAVKTATEEAPADTPSRKATQPLKKEKGARDPST